MRNVVRAASVLAFVLCALAVPAAESPVVRVMVAVDGPPCHVVVADVGDSV
jgi:hypothetical protein